MKVSPSVLVAAGLIANVQAHTRIWGIWVNDVFQNNTLGQAQGWTDANNTQGYIRSPPTNNPFKDLADANINCNVNNVAVTQKVGVNAGDKITFEWYHSTRADDILDPSHLGPIIVYIAKYSTYGNGNVWTKLDQSGYDGSTWATSNMIAAKGKYSFVLPKQIANGDYLLRAEVIALHEADVSYASNPARGAQFYPSCQQIMINNGGSQAPPGIFNFVGGYNYNDPGIVYNVYAGSSTYAIPGPTVWTPSGAAQVTTSTTLSTSKATTTTTTSKSITTTSKSSSTSTFTTLSTMTVASTCTASNIPQYSQCAGSSSIPCGKCVPPYTCQMQNQYYSQCL